MRPLSLRIAFVLTVCLLAVAPHARAESASSAPQLVLQRGHSLAVFTAALSPDGRYLLTASVDKTAKLWEVSSGRELRTFAGHNDVIYSVAFSPDGALALTASNDATMRLWEVATGREVRVVRDTGGSVMSALFSSDGRTILSAGADGKVRITDAATGQVLRTFEGHTAKVNTAVFTPDGRRILSGSDDRTARLWDVETGALLRTMTGSTNNVIAVAVAPGGRLAASSAGRGYNGLVTEPEKVVRLWDLESGRQAGSLAGAPGEVHGLAFSHDGRRLAAACGELIPNGTEIAVVWEVASGRKLLGLTGQQRESAAISFSPDDRLILTASADQTARLWDSSTGRAVRSFGRSCDLPTSLACSADGRYLMTGLDTYDYKIWDLSSGRQVVTRSRPERMVKLRMTPDGHSLLEGLIADNTIRLVEWPSLREVRTFAKLSYQLRNLALSRDGRLVLATVWDGKIELFEGETGRMVREIGGGKIRSNAGNTALSPDGSLVAITDENYGVELWDSATDRMVARLTGHTAYVGQVLFSPDGRTIVTASADRTIRLWDVASATQRRVIAVDGGLIYAVAISPDGRRLLSGGEDNFVRLWDLSTGAELARFSGGSSSITGLAWSPDGRFAFSAGYDMRVRVWSLDLPAPADGRPVEVDRELCSLSTFPDGHWAVVAPDGRFDTDALDGNFGMHWVVPDDPFTPLPLEIFFRDYYEPRLLTRILAGERFEPIRSIAEVNRARPTVRVAKVEPDGEGTASVTVEVSKGTAEYHRGGRVVRVESGARDLRLFRDGQLVAASPERGGDVALDTAGRATVTFRGIALPRAAGVDRVEFSAYAFNDDRIKSATDRMGYALPHGLAPIRGRAYLIDIGVNAYEDPSLDLRFAANDARRIQSTVGDLLASRRAYEQIVPLPLLSDSSRAPGGRTVTVRAATKAAVRAVFEILAGRPADRAALASVPNAELLAKAGPEDFVLISFSGHGYADGHGAFYFVPYDIGREARARPGRPGRRLELGAAASPSGMLARCISSDELSDWLRGVDAGEMVLIVDACQSAASVAAPGFKPGPMDSRGLGQLAYDKGMRILAATQADDVALESKELQQGLLTYALVHDGLEAGQADFRPRDGEISLSEWLSYAVERVPALVAEVRSGRVQSFGGEVPRLLVHSAAPAGRSAQQPTLFDFSRTRRDVVLVRVAR